MKEGLTGLLILLIFSAALIAAFQWYSPLTTILLIALGILLLKGLINDSK